MIFTFLLPALLISGGLVITGVGVAAQRAGTAASRGADMNQPSPASQMYTGAQGAAGAVVEMQPPTDPLLLADIPTFTPQSQLAFQAKIDWDLDNVS